MADYTGKQKNEYAHGLLELYSFLVIPGDTLVISGDQVGMNGDEGGRGEGGAKVWRKVQ